LPLCASGALPNVERTSKNRAAHSVNAFALRQREVEDLGAKSDTTPSNTCSIADLADNIIQYHHVVFWLKLAHSTKVDTGFVIRIHASYRTGAFSREADSTSPENALGVTMRGAALECIWRVRNFC
jgi:hypothetical protein